MIPWLALALSCGGGSTDRTVIDRLQVVAIVADPAEAGPGEDIVLDVVVANPNNREVEILQWSCMLYEGKCLEAYSPDSERWLGVQVLDGNHAVFERHLPSDVDQVLALAEAELGELPAYVDIQISALACVAGQCPLIDEVKYALEFPNDSYPEVTDQLADPESWLADLPVGGTSLATRSFRLSLRAADARNDNPTAEARFPEADDDVLVASTSSWLELAFWVEDPDLESVYVYPQTTAGQFDDDKVKAEDGIARHYLLGTERGVKGHVFVVFDDRDGGIAVWDKEVVVK